MKLTNSGRGFEQLRAVTADGGMATIVRASGAIGDYDDSWGRPGSSFLWIGADHHLNRKQIAELAERLAAWVRTGSLSIERDAPSTEER